MKLEAGKTYVTRSGLKVRVLCTDAPGGYPVVAMSESGLVLKISEAGRLYNTEAACDNHWDIVGPWVEKPVFDRSLLPSWKAVAMDEDGAWFAYTEIPEQGEDGWETDGAVSYIRIDRAPKWEGDWKDSLLVWEDEQ